MTDTVLVELYEVTFGVLEPADDTVTVVASDSFGMSTSGGGGGAALTVKEEGSAVDTAVESINVVGGALTAAQTASGAVSITSTAYYPGGTDVPVTDGGTGSSTAAGARTNLSAERLATFNVKDYGAVGDGSTDDTTAVQAAYTAAAVSGGTVLFPGGTYQISTSLTRAKGVRIEGLQGSSASTGFYPTLRWAGSSGGTIEVITSTGTTQPAPRDRFMKWDGGGTTSVPLADHAITAADRMDWAFGAEDCAYVRFNDCAIVLSKGAVNAQWLNCRWDIITNYGIQLLDGGSGYNDNISVVGGTWDGYGPTAGTKGFIQYAPSSASSSLHLGVTDFRLEVNGALVVPSGSRPKALIALDLDVVSDPLCQAVVNLNNVMVTPTAAAYDCVVVGQTGASDVRQWVVVGSGVWLSQHASDGGVLLVDGAGVAGPPSNAAYPFFVYDPMHTQGAGTNSTEYDSNVWIGPGNVIMSGGLAVAGTFSGSYANQGTLYGPRGGGAESQLMDILDSTGLYTDATSAIYGETTNGATLSGYGITGVDATGASRTPKLYSATAARLGFELIVFKMDAVGGRTVTVGVQSGEYMNNTLDGTFVLSDQGDYVRFRCVEQGFGSGTYQWLTVGTNVGVGAVTSVGGNTGAITDAQLLASIKNVDGSGSGLDADLLDGQSSAAFEAAGTAASLISDTAYDATSWNGDTTHAPSKNAVRDKIETLSSPAASSVTITDSGAYFTGTDVEAALQELGPAIDTATLQKLTAGISVPVNSLDRWKAGRGMEATFLAGAMDASQTTCGFIDSSIIHDTTVSQVVRIEDEEVFVTATSAGRTITTGGTATSTALTDSANGFAATDEGRVVTGSGIPRYTYISAYVGVGQVTLSQATTATASGVTVNIGARHTIERGINGTTAASHATLAECKTARHRRVAHLGDSIAEGVTTSTIVAGDGWSVRGAKLMANRLGGLIGTAWPMWRNTATLQVHQEYVLTGSSTVTGGSNADVGWGTGSSSLYFTGSSSNGWVWTRPAGVRVQTADIMWLDNGTSSCNWSYSTDGGSTWTTNPQSTTIYSSGKYLMRRTRLTGLDDPTTIRVRAADSGGTSKTCYFPYGSPLITYSTPLNMGVTEGVVWANYGFAGAKLRSFLNSRTFTDAVVTNGSADVSSATAAFVAADVGSTIYLEGVAYTILQLDGVTPTTKVQLTTNYAGTSGSSKRITVFQNGGTASDKTGLFVGHHGSTFPDLIIVGPFTNDMGLATVANGDTNEYAMYDMLTYLVGRLKTLANVLLIAPYELSSYGSTLQGNYRTQIELVATEQNVASLNLYDVFDAYGAAGYTAVNAAGYMADGAHLSAAGNRFVGAHLARVLEIV